MNRIILSILLLNSLLSFGQNEKKDINELRIPKNLNQCFRILDETLPEETISLLKASEDSSINNVKIDYKSDFYHAWKIYDGTRIAKYFNKKGLYGPIEIRSTILLSYHHYLNNEPIELEEQIKKHQDTQKKQHEAYIERTKMDSINGIYIPKNIEDCFISLNEMLSIEEVTSIKNLESRDDVIKYHLGFGMWLRNNWGLWSGSRLQVYLFDKGLNHPDQMSHLILMFYYDWLNNEHTAWKQFEEQ